MTKKRIGQILLGLVAAATLAACGSSGDPLTEAGAMAAANALKPQVQSTLEAAGFKGVTVDTEMENEGGKQFAIVYAQVSLNQLRSGCRLEYESRATSLKLYFDEVITPSKRDGIEVKGGARNDVTPKGAFNYLRKNHPACLVPNAVAPPK